MLFADENSPVFASLKLWAAVSGVEILLLREVDWQTIPVGILGCPSNSLFELRSGRMSVLIILKKVPLWREHWVERHAVESSTRVRVAVVNVVFLQVQRMLGAVLKQLAERNEWQVGKNDKALFLSKED
jgi:hypothetical protein